MMLRHTACGPMKRGLVIISFVVLLALCASAIAFTREKTVLACLQLIGSVFLAVMVCTHVAETYRVFPQMGWGLQHSAGHYIDLVSAWGGVTLFVPRLFAAEARPPQSLKSAPPWGGVFDALYIKSLGAGVTSSMKGEAREEMQRSNDWRSGLLRARRHSR